MRIKPRHGDIPLQFGDVLRWVGTSDPQYVMFVRWAIPTDEYHYSGTWCGVALADLTYRIDPGYPAPAPKGSPQFHWELVDEAPR